jgi:hypothetical protein
LKHFVSLLKFCQFIGERRAKREQVIEVVKDEKELASKA